MLQKTRDTKRWRTKECSSSSLGLTAIWTMFEEECSVDALCQSVGGFLRREREENRRRVMLTEGIPAEPEEKSASSLVGHNSRPGVIIARNPVIFRMFVGRSMANQQIGSLNRTKTVGIKLQ